MVGHIRNQDGAHPKSRRSLFITSTDGFATCLDSYVGPITDSLGFDYVNFLPNGEIRILANDGIYNQDLTKIYSINEASPFATQYGFRFIDNNLGFAALNSGNMIETTNGGYNWSTVTTIGYGIEFGSEISSVGEIAYYGNATNRNLFTRKLSTDLKTYFDIQSVSSSIFFDGTEYSTPNTTYLRGGNSIVYSPLAQILNSNQTNERQFYAWSNGNMDYNDHNFYFDLSGTEIANYYKTKQLSTTSEAISNISQTKVLKDEWGAINQIHQSMNGGIFFCKSYNNGSTFKREEIVNKTPFPPTADANKNPALYETKFGSSFSPYPVNKNVVACWERFNTSNQKTEIKVAVRDISIATSTDTSFYWRSWETDNYTNDVFTSFNSSSEFNSNPKIFSIFLNNPLGDPNSYFFIVPHLRPASNGIKLAVTCRKGTSWYSEFVLDSGDISSVAVVDSVKNVFGHLRLHFVYTKDNQIIYRKVAFDYQDVAGIEKTNLEGPINISSGDGYSSRYSPDISLMDSIPVVTYSASYSATRLVQFENNGGTEEIPVTRFPIVKVQRINSNTWSNYVIYSSNSFQEKPDIEGSKDTKSYIINYSLGNELFKKVTNIENHPGYFCQPSVFNGTDSRLINNSYSGLFGSNLTLLTLSPQSNLYKLDKQNFILTNISAADEFNVDNIDGVVNLDTIKYTFKLGPILLSHSKYGCKIFWILLI